MRLETLLPLVLLGSLAPGCGDNRFGGGDDDPDLGEFRPFVGDWEKPETIQLPFTADGDYAITTLRIGGTAVGTGQNFANRGDIVVVYDADPGEMLIETRKFTHARSTEGAEADFARLQLWLSDANFEQPPPVPQLGDDTCAVGMWRDGCGIRTWYDGQSQEARSGMDLRVHLPSDFLARIEVTTEDNDIDEDYQRRGDVCLWDLPASAKVNLAQGEVLVKMADDVIATPTCAEEDIAACDAVEWANDCPCFAKGDSPSSVRIEGQRSDIGVSLPSSTFAKVFVENREGQPPQRDACSAAIDVPGAVLEPSDKPWKQVGVIASRGSETGALEVSAFSDECDSVFHVESPDFYVPGGDGQEDPRRGDITVCDGCIQNLSCDDFLEDGLRLSN